MASAAPAASQPASAITTTPASPAPKDPPPEKEADIKQRGYFIFSFWLIVVLLGLPIWWKTTTIYRANLPLDGMLEWANGKVSLLSSTQLDCGSG